MPEENDEHDAEQPSHHARITIRVGRIGDELRKVSVAKGTTVGQLVLAKGRMINPSTTWRPTDVMGLGIPIASELTQDQIVILSDITQPMPASVFEEH